MGQERAPAYQWYPRDFLASSFVASLTPEQECAYRRLLDYAWIDGSIPDDPAQLAPLCRLTRARMERAWAVLRAKFVPMPGEPGRLVNARQEEERAIQAHWRGKSAKGGRESARVRREARERLAGGTNQEPRVVEPPLPNGSNQTATPHPQSSVRSSLPSPGVPLPGDPPPDGGPPEALEPPPGKSPRKTPPEDAPEVHAIAAHFADCIRRWKPDAVPRTDSPASRRGLDGLVRLDGRPEADVRALLSWLFGSGPGDYRPRDAFDWRPNVLSGGKLRRQWDVLDALRRARPVRDPTRGYAEPAPASAFGDGEVLL